MLTRVAIAVTIGLGAALAFAAPAGAQPGRPPCDLALTFICNIIPSAPELDHDVDLLDTAAGGPERPGPRTDAAAGPLLGGLYLEPGVVGGGGEERLEIVAPVRGTRLVGLDTGVVASIEQQGPRLLVRHVR